MNFIVLVFVAGFAQHYHIDVTIHPAFGKRNKVIYGSPKTKVGELTGFNYTTAGETNLIGFHAQGNYSTAVGESYALMGMALWAEYLDGIAVISFGDAGGATGATGATGED